MSDVGSVYSLSMWGSLLHWSFQCIQQTVKMVIIHKPSLYFALVEKSSQNSRVSSLPGVIDNHGRLDDLIQIECVKSAVTL